MRNTRPGVLRGVTLFALWAAAATGATLVGLTAVGAIGTGIVNPGPPPLTPAEIGNRLGAAAPTPRTDPPVPTTTVAPSPGEVLVIGAGGTVVATCAGGVVRILAVSPAQGSRVLGLHVGHRAAVETPHLGLDLQSRRLELDLVAVVVGVVGLLEAPTGVTEGKSR